MKKITVFIASCSPWMLIAVFILWAFSEVWQRIDYAAYAYPQSVVIYNLKDAKDSDEMLRLVKEWHSLHWGAQIAALQVLCDKNRSFVNQLAGQESATKICRVVK